MVVKGPFDPWHPVFKYIFVYAAALCIYIIQYKLVKKILERNPDSRFAKYFIG